MFLSGWGVRDEGEGEIADGVVDVGEEAGVGEALEAGVDVGGGVGLAGCEADDGVEVGGLVGGSAFVEDLLGGVAGGEGLGVEGGRGDENEWEEQEDSAGGHGRRLAGKGEKRR
jgi:hypothetical protein